LTLDKASPRPDTRTLLAFAVVVVLLGVNFVAVRFSNAELAPFWGSGVRFAFAAAALLLLTFIRHVPLPREGTLRSSVAYGALAFGLTYALVYWGILAVPSGVASVIFASIPLSTFVLALLLKMETFRMAGLAGASLALVGITVVSYAQLSGKIALLPVLAVIASSFTAAGAGIVVKRAPKSHPLSTNAVAMAVGAAMLLTLSLLAGEPKGVPSLAATWIAFAWLVTSSIVAFSLFIWILKRWTASAASYQTVLSPLVTIAVASMLVAEPLTISLAAGAGLVLGGVFLGAIWRRGPRTGRPAPTGSAEPTRPPR